MNFRTIIVIISLLLVGNILGSLEFFEDWESGSFFANAWSFEFEQGNWEIFPYQGNPGSSARFAGNPPLSEYSHILVSPILNGTEDSNIYLSFDLIAGLLQQAGSEQLSVLCRIFGGDWQEIAVYDSNTPGGDNDWQNETFNLSSYIAGEMFQVGFQAHGSDSFSLIRWNLDNIHVTSDMNSDPATISGIVYDQETSDPIENALVTVNGISDTTSAEGYYELTLDPGAVTIEVSAEEYNPSSLDYLLESGQTYTQDFYLVALSSILPPEDFITLVDSNDVTLSWQTPGLTTSISEGFENWPPPDWQIKTSTQADGSDLTDPYGDSWFQVNAASFMGAGSDYIHSGQYAAGIEYFAANYNWLISPEFLVQPETQLNFWLWYYSDDYYVSNFYVCIKINDQWQTLQSWTDMSDTNTMQAPVNIDLGLYQNNEIQIAFVSEYNDGYEIAVDDVTIGTNLRLIPDGYNVYRNGLCLNQTPITANSYEDLDLSNGEYSYEVTALYGDIESPPAGPQDVIVNYLESPDFFFLEMSFYYEDEDITNAWLGWSDINFATGYNIYRNDQLITPEPLTESNYRDFSCENPMQYEYYITAVFELGESAPSNTQQLDYFLPAQNLYAIPYPTYNYLHWEAPQVDNEDASIIGYNIYYDSWMLINDEPLTEQEYYDYEVITGEYYSYSVSVVYSCGESLIHGSVSVTAGSEVILPPENFTGEVEAQDVKLAWDRPAQHGQWLKHGFETYGGEFESGSDESYSAYVYFNQADLTPHDNETFEQLAFWPTNGNAVYTVNFYKPDIFNPDNFLLMQSIEISDIIPDAWNIVDINGGDIAGNETEFKIEICCDDYTQPFLAYDAGTNTNNRSDLIYQDGNWENLSDYDIDANWKIKLLLLPNTGGGGWRNRSNQIGLENYRIYRDAELIAETNHAYENFNDHDLDFAEYAYTMTAVYNVMDETIMESEPTAEITFVITENLLPPVNLEYVILDSTVVLNWEAPQDLTVRELTGYTVYLNSSEIAETQTTSFELTGLTYGENYLAGICADYTTGSSELVEVEFTYTGTYSPDDIPLHTELAQNYPNPFNPVTNIAFSLAQTSQVKLVIYNLKGQLIKSLINENLKAGYYNLQWNGKNSKGKQVSSGMYFYTLQTDSFTSTQKMILMK